MVARAEFRRSEASVSRGIGVSSRRFQRLNAERKSVHPARIGVIPPGRAILAELSGIPATFIRQRNKLQPSSERA